MFKIAAQRNSEKSQDFERDDSEWKIEAAQPKAAVVKPPIAPKPTLNKSLSASDVKNETEIKPILNNRSSTNVFDVASALKNDQVFAQRAAVMGMVDDDDWDLGDGEQNNVKNTTQEVKKESNTEFQNNKSKIATLLGKGRGKSFLAIVENDNKGKAIKGDIIKE